MNEKNDFALVPRPSGSLEKMEPGAKRILRSMVADTLALVKRDCLTVLMCDDHISDSTEAFLKFELAERYELRFVRFKSATELLKLAQERPFDLVFLYIGNVQWDVGTGDYFCKAADILGRVKAQYKKPIIATQGMDLTEQFKGTGVTFITAPYDLQTFRNALDISLNGPILSGKKATTRSPARTRPLRVVMINDEPFVHHAFEHIIRNSFRNVTVLTFENGAEALEELSRTDPDLLITDDRMPKMSGGELCQHLLDRKVSYPIIVNSAWGPTEQWVREFGGQGLNVSFLPIPCDITSLVTLIEASLKVLSDRIEKPDEFAPQTGQLKRPRIVILDDEEGPRKSHSIMIKWIFDNAEILGFESSIAAWEELSSADPDLFITDITHPGISCREMLARLAERRVRYPILVISAYESYDEIVKSWGPGLNVKYLPKPVSIDDFWTAVKAAFEIRAQSTQ